MATATADINAPHKYLERVINVPLAASTKVFGGAIAAVDSAGRAVVALAATADLDVAGRYQAQVDNSSGAAEDENVDVAQGVFRWNNSSGDAVTQADVGKPCWLEDDNTVARVPGANAMAVGWVEEVDSDGVWVRSGLRVIDNDEAMAYTADEAITAPGAISVLTRRTTVDIDGTDAYTLADGVFVGQTKEVVCVAVANSPSGDITPANFNDGTSVSLTVVGQAAVFRWDGSGWDLVHTDGTVA